MRTRTAELLWPPSVTSEKAVLERFDFMVADTELVLSALPWLDGVGAKILQLADRLVSITDLDPDAAIAAVHLPHAHRPAIAQAVQAAILCCVTGRRLGFDEDHLRRVVAAALSANASVLKLQDELNGQKEQPTATQLMAIRTHPRASVDLLERTGVDDDIWLDIVAQHHERPDGRGYPVGLDPAEILSEALMVGLSDRYVAYIGRPNHAECTARRGMRDVFEDPGYGAGNPLVAAFIKELTIFPPGSMIRLASGEEAVVVRRGSDTLCPDIAILGAPKPRVTSIAQITDIADDLPARPLSEPYRALWVSG